MISEEFINDKWNNLIKVRNSVPEEEREKNKEYQAVRNPLMEIYYPLVIKVADKMQKKYKEVDYNDLVSWGTDGLFHSINRFDPERKNKFETYAVHRIKGAIIDNIRQVDWVPRLVRQRYSSIQKAKNTLESELGRVPTNEEMAAHMGLSIEKFIEIEAKSNPVACYSMYAGRSADTDTVNEEIQLESFATEEDQPVDSVLKDEMFKKLMGRNFIPLERKIIHMHYYNNMTMKEIADNVGYSESRISQMHAKILERLQKKVKLNPNYMKDLVAILHS